MAGGLTIKIGADVQGAVSQFNSLTDSQNQFIKSLEAADKVLAKSNIDAFSDKQKVAQMALTATRGEFEAVSASVKAYQNKIEALLKQGIDPESEGIQKLVSEMEDLKSRKEAMSAATGAQAQREAELAAKFEEAARAAENEAEIAIRSLDAKTGLEKENVRLAAEQDKVRESIKKLISSGMDPESEEVKELEGEYKKLTSEIEANNRAQEMQENAAKGVATALAAIAAATAAVIGYSVTQAAKVEDMTAAYTTLLGSQEKAAELVKRINKEAATTPFEIESISGSMNKLLPLFKGNSNAAVKAFRMIGDTAGGNAQKLDTLTDAYAKVQMKGKTSMTELNRISDAGVPIFAVLSENLGVTTEKLFEMSSEGQITADDLTAAFEQMTSEGGVFFNGMENSSDTFNMRLLGIKENVSILAGEIGAKFLPALKEVAGNAGDAVAAFSEWISEGDNLDNLLDGITYALAEATAGMAAFLIVMKGKEAVEGMKKAVEGLNTALKGNMLGLIAAGITAVAIPAFMALAKHIEKSQNEVRELNKELQNGKETYSQATTALSGLDDKKALDAETTEKLINLYPDLTGKLTAYKTSVEDARAAVEELSRAKQKDKIDEMVAAYKKEIEAINKYQEKLNGAKAALGNASKDVTDHSIMMMENAVASLTAQLGGLTQKAEKSAAAIRTAYEGIGEEVIFFNFGEAVTRPLKEAEKAAGQTATSTGNTIGGNVAAAVEKTLSEKLNGIKLTPAQDYAQDLADFESYLNSMADMENLSGEARVAAIQAQERRILKAVTLTEAQRKGLAEASAAAQ